MLPAPAGSAQHPRCDLGRHVPQSQECGSSMAPERPLHGERFADLLGGFWILSRWVRVHATSGESRLYSMVGLAHG